MTLLLTEVPTDWEAIWSITFVSFGLVLVILFLLVYVMKIFGLFFKEKTTKTTAAVAATAENAVAGSDEEVVAAIATAIALAQGALHVEESGVLTFAGDRKTSWNDKAYGITRMPGHIQ